MFPTREEAEKILNDGYESCPGPWADHSRTAAHCAACIARACRTLDPEKAYVLGLLHDIGRKFGHRHLGHVSDGYSYMMSLDYDEVARICLTHSFYDSSMDGYVGNHDTTAEETERIKTELRKIEFDEYDRLIQLCDAISGAEGVMDMIDRMSDVKRRYGDYDQRKWNHNLALKKHFEDLAGQDLYEIVDQEHFKPRGRHE